MRTVLCTYLDINHNSRAKELVRIIKLISEQVAVVTPHQCDIELDECIVTGLGQFKYVHFIKKARDQIKRRNPDCVVFENNRCALLVGIIKKMYPQTKIIYDSAELYIEGIPKGIKQKLALVLRLFEKKYMKLADVVLAANIERAEIMKDYFELNKVPIVFDNIHRITATIDTEHCKKKFEDLFKDDRYTVLYSGGVSSERMTNELAEAFTKLNGYQLIIVGSAVNKDLQLLNGIIKRTPYNNIFYKGLVSQGELLYLTKKCNVTAALYRQDTINNTYCASGKVYEGMFEGKPIIVSTNPPLRKLCETHKVGVSTEDLLTGIQELRANDAYYRKNVKTYMNTYMSGERQATLIGQICERLSMGE